jgi:hypothetical protein
LACIAALPWHDGDNMQPGAKKNLITVVTVIGVAIQIVWATALSYPLALVVIGITRGLAQL